MDVDGEGEGNQAAANKSVKRAFRKERKVAKQERLEGRGELDALGINYHSVFGPKHKYVMPKNHWKDFCSAVSNGTPLNCAICQELLGQARVKKETMDGEDAEETVAEVAVLTDAGRTQELLSRRDSSAFVRRKAFSVYVRAVDPRTRRRRCVRIYGSF